MMDDAPGLLQQLTTTSEHPRVTAFGCAYGAVPTGTAFILAHYALPQLYGELPDFVSRVRLYALIPVLLACLVFSVRTVWDFSARFGGSKAVCLMIVLEGVMVFAPYTWHAGIALACLVLINAIATACTLVAEDVKAATPEPSPIVVEDVARELGLTRRGAAKVVERRPKLSREQPA